MECAIALSRCSRVTKVAAKEDDLSVAVSLIGSVLLHLKEVDNLSLHAFHLLMHKSFVLRKLYTELHTMKYT